MTESLKIRPYARLLTMLGDQLITNEQVALFEIIKNAYDADAQWVKISFENFEDDLSITPDSKIIIEDDGDGMSEQIIKDHWLNPATPEKKRRREQKREMTELGRIIQGEKGIGRFSLLKLGSNIRVTTRARIKGTSYEGEDTEQILTYNFGKYGDEFLTEDGKNKDLYLDELSVTYDKRQPETIVAKNILLNNKNIIRKPCGTKIEICALKGTWNNKIIEKLYQNFAKLTSPFNEDNDIDFTLYVEKDGLTLEWLRSQYAKDMDVLLNEVSVIQIKNGIYNEDTRSFSYTQNGNPYLLSIDDPVIKGLYPYKKYKSQYKQDIITKCGSFKFEFYIFDFSRGKDVPAKHKLTDTQRKTVRENRIYLYRDNVRVFPYGDPDDDWLQIDVMRGVVSAGYFLSNDQVMGRIDISQSGNPNLKDKTSREGLIEDGENTKDFITLIQLFLAYIRAKSYAQYKIDTLNRNKQDIFAKKKVQQNLDDFRELIRDNPIACKKLDEVEILYQTERTELQNRVNIVEELAGLGLSIGVTTHDLLSFIDKSNGMLDILIKDFVRRPEEEQVLNRLNTIRGIQAVVHDQVRDIQSLFTASKRRRKAINVRDILEKLINIYNQILVKDCISINLIPIGASIKVNTTDAVLWQVFINLFDNAVYWLRTVNQLDKKIWIRLDGTKNQVIFSDNGPGIADVDKNYIFEPFYSGKGETGKGLGLYIARQLLERDDNSINLASTESEKLLSGANFVINFYEGDDEK